MKKALSILDLSINIALKQVELGKRTFIADSNCCPGLTISIIENHKKKNIELKETYLQLSRIINQEIQRNCNINDFKS